ncbi:hypothetical protein QAD02_020264 [Eretmocerus hayati]|uniref:Uncharacterized protein n=1 Tax=Eretmocerus hayati TaxID=131215 RepID=A0ACC2PM55_9HYME|nr:hypothetical protein QAD02_020264 [Eretmocerus hayati]
MKDDSIWPMTAWLEEAERMKKIILVGDVIHIDGIYVKAVDPDSKFSFQKSIAFTIQSNSVVTNLTKLYFPITPLQDDRDHQNLKVYDDIQDCVNENFGNKKPVCLILYVKSMFVQGNPNLTLRFGALTDKKIKLTTCVKNYDNTQMIYEVGEKIKVYGRLSEYKEKVCLEIFNLKDIYKLEEEFCPSNDMRSIISTPKKPQMQVDSASKSRKTAKKLKLDQ